MSVKIEPGHKKARRNIDTPRVFDWNVYGKAYESSEVNILGSLALQQWQDGHDLPEYRMDEDEEKRFAEGFKAGFIAGRTVGEVEPE